MNRSIVETVKKIKPIQFSYNFDNKTNSKSLYFNANEVNTRRNKISVFINIDPNKFIHKTSNIKILDTNNHWFINLSNNIIPKEVSNLLQLGGKFSLPILNNKKKAIHEFIKDVESNNKKYNISNQISIRNTSIPLFHFYIIIKNHRYPERQLLQCYTNTLQFCRTNPNIIFTRADKGNVTVVLDRKTYISKIEGILNDSKSYTVVKKNSVKKLKIEKTLNDLLKKWLEKDFISKKEYFNMRFQST